jgi:glycopeptide antibiotics resistance protein
MYSICKTTGMNIVEYAVKSQLYSSCCDDKQWQHTTASTQLKCLFYAYIIWLRVSASTGHLQVMQNTKKTQEVLFLSCRPIKSAWLPQKLSQNIKLPSTHKKYWVLQTRQILLKIFLVKSLLRNSGYLST